MGSTASINYAASRKYKPSEPIEVKFDKIVKYDDGEEKPFKENLSLGMKKQPLSLLASAIRMLEYKPKPVPSTNGYISEMYSKQPRPRSAYIVYNKQTPSSSTFNSSQRSLPNGLHSKQKKQIKTKQNLYMSLINPMSANDSKFGMTVPSRLRTPVDYHLPPRPPKAHTLPRPPGGDGKRVRVNHRLYLDMIRPVMSSQQNVKLADTKRTQQVSLTRQNMSRQSGQTSRQDNGVVLRGLDQNSRIQRQHKPRHIDEIHNRRHKDQFYNIAQNHHRIIPNSSMNNSVNSSVKRELHLPRLPRKTRDDLSLDSSHHFRSQVPGMHPNDITPLCFRTSLAYSPQYERRELLSSPFSSRNPPNTY